MKCKSGHDHYFGSEEVTVCNERAERRIPYEQLAMEVELVPSGAFNHTRARAKGVLRFECYDNRPDFREAVAVACRAALFTGDWKPVQALVWPGGYD
jgi:hypothetical protein